jgi:hypothetical protein
MLQHIHQMTVLQAKCSNEVGSGGSEAADHTAAASSCHRHTATETGWESGRAALFPTCQAALSPNPTTAALEGR